MKTRAEIEFELLRQRVDGALILEFEDEIRALVDKFMDSGQSGGSAPYVASAISQAVEKLCLFQPLTPIEENEDSWIPESYGREMLFQNSRLSSLFKDNSGVYYLNAIVWRDEYLDDDGEKCKSAFIGTVYRDIDSFEKIGSRQNVKFPFEPKEFYIDVDTVSFSELKEKGVKEEVLSQLNYRENGEERWITVVKNSDDLKPVFEYYEERKP